MSSYNDIGLVLVALVQILSFGVLWRKLSGAPESREISPQPLEVKPAAEYMTRQSCREMHTQTERFESEKFGAIEKQLSAMTAALERRNTEGEARASKIHSRIDAVVEAVAEVRGQVNNHIQHGGHNAG